MSSPQLKSPTTLIHDRFHTPGSNTDLIVRTSDDVRLYVAKFFLTYHSQFFANLFADSAPDETEEAFPVFRADEDSCDMRAILHLCYPMNAAAIPYVLETAFSGSLLPALQKYMMKEAETCLRELVAASEWPKQEPLKTFVMARRYRWEDIGRTAAWESLCYPLREHTSVPELGAISALDYRCLMDYFWRCSDTARCYLEGTRKGRFKMPNDFHDEGLILKRQLSLKLDSFPEPLSSVKPFQRRFGRKLRLIPCSGCLDPKVPDARLFCCEDDSENQRHMHPWFRPFLQRARCEVERCPRISLSHECILQDSVFTAAKACPSQKPEMVHAIVELVEDSLKDVLRSVKLEVAGW